MNESREQIINAELEKLSTYLKIDTNEKSWQFDLQKELKATNIYYKVYRIIGMIFFGGAAIMGLVALIADGETIFGILIKEQYLYQSILITSIAGMFSFVGRIELKKERIKTVLLLKDLIK